MSQVLIDVTILFGSALGVTLATMIPYLQKDRTSEAIGDGHLKFDKKFIGTLVMALVIGIVTAIMSFDTTSANVDQHGTIVKIFIAAFIAGGGSNLIINGLLKVSNLAPELKAVKAENEQLKQAVQSMRLENKISNSL